MDREGTLSTRYFTIPVVEFDDGTVGTVYVVDKTTVPAEGARVMVRSVGAGFYEVRMLSQAPQGKARRQVS